MIEELTASTIIRFHDRKLTDAECPADGANQTMSAIWRSIEMNHRYNTLLWNEEDRARRTKVDPTEIAASKRLIDQYNQIRNDAVETMDEIILSGLNHAKRAEGAKLHSETAGAMIDRLSILGLKIYHMREQTQRNDVDQPHRDRCRRNLQQLILQRNDLASCFDRLISDIVQGCAYFKVYRQFKMYNDPALNPYLCSERRQTEIGKNQA